MSRTRSVYAAGDRGGNAALEALIACFECARLRFWNRPRTSFVPAGLVSAYVDVALTHWPPMIIGCFCPKSARPLSTAASYAAWNSSVLFVSTAFCHVRSFRNSTIPRPRATDASGENKVSPLWTDLSRSTQVSRKSRGTFDGRSDLERRRSYRMYESGEPSYLSYCAMAPIAASSSRAHSRVYEFGGTSVVVPSHSKISLNAERCSSFVRRASIFVMVCSSRFTPRPHSLHSAKNVACSSRVLGRPAGPCGPPSIKLRKCSWVGHGSWVLMATFVRVAKTSDVPAGGGRVVVVQGHPVALFNVEGRFYAVSTVCLHRGGPIGEGCPAAAGGHGPNHRWG